MYRYEENVTFHPMVQVGYVLGVAALVWVQLQAVPEFLGLSLALSAPLILLPATFGRLLIRVDADTLTVEFGYLGWPIQRVSLDNIVGARSLTYRPIRRFGGWGIRAGRLDDELTSVYSVRGSSGVLVELAAEQRISGRRTKRFLIGSAEPDRLVAALGKR